LCYGLSFFACLYLLCFFVAFLSSVAYTSAVNCVERLVPRVNWFIYWSIEPCSRVFDAGDYEGALARLTEMIYLLQDQPSLLSSASGQHVGIFADVTTSCELLRVFLLLLLQVRIHVSSPSLIRVPSSRQHQSCGDCLKIRRENNQNSSVLCRVQQLCTVMHTHVGLGLDFRFMYFECLLC